MAWPRSLARLALNPFSTEASTKGRTNTSVIPGASETVAVGINDKGQIAGTYNTDTWPYVLFHGFVGSPTSGFTTFDVPGGSETDPSGINNSGQITGNYFDSSGYTYGFILTP